jgi:hypothetical protein
MSWQLECTSNHRRVHKGSLRLTIKDSLLGGGISRRGHLYAAQAAALDGPLHQPRRLGFLDERGRAERQSYLDAAEVNTPDTRESCVSGKRANPRLAPNKRKSPLDLVSDGSRSCNSIELPPIRRFVDFRGSATSNADRKQFDLSAIAQPGEEIFSGDRVAALRLVDCFSAGKKRMLFTSANMAPTQMPTKRNGNAMSHTSGNKTNTANATGHDRTNKTHQTTMSARSFTQRSFL